MHDSTASLGPLRRHSENPRYFADALGKPVLLAGSHTWANLVEIKIYPEEADFNYEDYLDFLTAHNHNFFRLWTWEHCRWANWDDTGRLFIYPLPYLRTGPGFAQDGLPRFDLSRFDPEFFRRLRDRVAAAGRRGIYVAVKLFDGFSVSFKSSEPKPDRNPYRGHCFNAFNNINGIDGDRDGDGVGLEIHTKAIPEITRLQEAYARQVIDMVNDLDNVLYEICNESEGSAEAVQWQYHMIEYIREYESKKPKQHPIGMTVPYPNGDNRVIFESPADWVSPNASYHQPYKDNPPPGDGRKVVISDTDHLWGHGGNVAWVWKSFTRGLNLLLMDPYHLLAGSASHPNNYPQHPTWEPIRRSMGDARALAETIDLAHMEPRSSLASTSFCLAHPGHEYVIYQPQPGLFTVNLEHCKDRCRVRWFDPHKRVYIESEDTPPSGAQVFIPPCYTDVVLHLKCGI